MYSASAYGAGGCHYGELAHLYTSVCQGFDLSLFGEDSARRPSYEDSMPFVGLREHDSPASEDAYSSSSSSYGSGETSWSSPGLFHDQASPPGKTTSESDSLDVHHYAFPNDLGQSAASEDRGAAADPWFSWSSPDSEEGSDEGSSSPSGRSSTPPLESRTLKMHEWPPQSNPEMERKRVRAVKQFLIRQRKKSQAEQHQRKLDRLRTEIASLKEEKIRKQKRLAIMNAYLQPCYSPDSHFLPAP